MVLISCCTLSVFFLFVNDKSCVLSSMTFFRRQFLKNQHGDGKRVSTAHRHKIPSSASSGTDTSVGSSQAATDFLSKLAKIFRGNDTFSAETSQFLPVSAPARTQDAPSELRSRNSALGNTWMRVDTAFHHSRTHSASVGHYVNPPTDLHEVQHTVGSARSTEHAAGTSVLHENWSPACQPYVSKRQTNQTSLSGVVYIPTASTLLRTKYNTH
jgi:hypothetical protein